MTRFTHRWFLSEYLVLVLTVLLFGALAPFTPGLATKANLFNILGYLLPLLIVAIGMTVVMITGGIDLSVTSIIALTSVVGAKLMTGDGTGTVVGRRRNRPAAVASRRNPLGGRAATGRNRESLEHRRAAHHL